MLQVYSPGPGWRSVCSDGWTQRHTEAACKKLGYTQSVQPSTTPRAQIHLRTSFKLFLSAHSKPQSSNVPVEDLIQSLKTGPFTAVRDGSASTPIHQATIDR